MSRSTTGEATTGQVSRSAAEVYDAFFVPALFEQFCESVLDAAGVGPGDAVLDVGCGTGVLTAAAAARVGAGGSATGLDLNPGMLEVAARARPDAHWEQGDAQHLPYPDGTFDAVVSQFALMFVPDPVRALQEASRVTRRGGRLAVAVWAPLTDSPGYAALAELLADVVGESGRQSLAAPFSLGAPGELARLFARAGLEASTTAVPGTARFASLTEWLETEVRGWTLAGSVDDATMEQLATSARPRLARFVEPDGRVAFAVTALLASTVVPDRATTGT